MSLPDLAAVLWRQRELLERLVYRLECEQLLLSAGRTRWLGEATAEVEILLEELEVVELQRAVAAQTVALELGLPADATLEYLAAGCQPPWTGVLLEHRQALIELMGELSTLADLSKNLMTAGMAAVEATLSRIGMRTGTSSLGYDAQGNNEMIFAPGAGVVDREL
ncbi:MAG: hypothetical protein QG608_2175 [Actinomycetota bacterium]|nr:hypothetical protein [Actinomycetota bacterium]